MGALIFLLYNSDNSNISKNIAESFLKTKKRGPDNTVMINESTVNINAHNQEQIKLQLSRRELAEYKQFNFITGYHRLSINDLTLDGEQPFEDPITNKILKYQDLRTRPKRKLICNGEIYNYEELKDEENFTDKDLQSNCDVEVILPMYIKYGLEDTLKKLNGDYSFILTENLNTYRLNSINVFVVRDILGIKPLYMVKGLKETFYMFVSELKSIPQDIMKDSSYKIMEIPPGTYWSFQNSVINNPKKSNEEFIRYSDWNYYLPLEKCIYNKTDPESLSKIYNDINTKLTKSVIDRYKSSSRSIGFLLSGGFDSSIILSIVLKYLKETNHNFENNPIHVFSMGELHNKDIKSSKLVVAYFEELYNIKLHHHIVSINSITDKELNDNIREVIYNIETYDIKTIRSALPYLYLFKYISKHTSIQVLLSGEGLDELCGYSKLFELSDENFQRKSIRLLKNMSKYNLLRMDKLAGAYSIELRYPFLDRDIVEYILKIHPKLKRPQVYNIKKGKIEKYIVRKSFDNFEGRMYLPKDVLWREMQGTTKCFDFLNERLRNYCETRYSDAELFDYLRCRKCNNKVTNKEQLYILNLYKSKFHNTEDLVPRYWENLWEN